MNQGCHSVLKASVTDVTGQDAGWWRTGLRLHIAINVVGEDMQSMR